MALDKVIGHILKLSRDAEGLLLLRDILKAEEKEISRNKQLAPGATQALDPLLHSLGYLSLLEVSGTLAEANQQFFDASIAFITHCDAAQIRLMPQKFASLCRKVKEQAILLNSPKQAIAPLMSALQKLEPSHEFVTPIHTYILQLCLLCKCYSAGASILSPDASEVDPNITALNPTDFLLYCYYGGMIHIGRKRYSEALQLFLQALTAPTMVVNAITMSAYKKYVLVSLIHRGNLPAHLPKFTTSSVTRAIKQDTTGYQELADSYRSRSNAFQKAVEKYRQSFIADGNFGLVNLAIDARTKRSIQRLTQTYLTLSLEHIAKTAYLPSAEVAEQHVLQMIESGDIFAEIDDQQGMVRFLEDAHSSDSSALMATLDSQIAQSIKLAERVRQLNYEVSCDKQLISKMEQGMFT